MWPISAINICFWLLVMTRVLSPQYWGILVTFCRYHLSLVLWRWKLNPPTEPRSPKATKSRSLAVPAVEGSRTPISGACCSERSRKSGTQASHQKYLLKINLEAVTGKLVFTSSKWWTLCISCWKLAYKHLELYFLTFCVIPLYYLFLYRYVTKLMV